MILDLDALQTPDEVAEEINRIFKKMDPGTPPTVTYPVNAPSGPGYYNTGALIPAELLLDPQVYYNTGKWQPGRGYDLDSNDTTPSETPTAPKDREAELRAKVLPKFRGEEKCDHSAANAKLLGAPKGPWMGVTGNGRAVTEKSMLAIKQWAARNFTAFPTCRHSNRNAGLLFEARRHEGGDGEYTIARFECECG